MNTKLYKFGDPIPENIKLVSVYLGSGSETGFASADELFDIDNTIKLLGFVSKYAPNPDPLICRIFLPNHKYSPPPIESQTFQIFYLSNGDIGLISCVKSTVERKIAERIFDSLDEANFYMAAIFNRFTDDPNILCNEWNYSE